ncbi:right-handed parallel beta-helix repeat-containing protein [Roseovarius sp. TE539]|uniref:right-handed parallel beta-helix repeat-containing protein n=1 Tax=Roseovarius sp. TE539 TaxID=2249812 RepID=UPI000DDDD650|nr:right-handed parallel beta-helix repeat-containing protein [Roseovarius sp. TE539]RBI73482.1 right-handed parallel beta-helix repeat-containing protein [Roseovarius sp. TE539]
MNKSITGGIVFMPPPFTDGLDVWSSGDGTAGSDTYEGALNAGLIAADQDFGGALELQKTENVQKLRFMGQTPILPGCFLRVTARVKAISGDLPTVRIAGWAGGAGGDHVAGLTETGPETTLQSYGEVVEVSAIVGVGQRTGVDMVWGPDPVYGHFGLDLTGPVGGIIRVDDLVIEDATRVFLRGLMDWVDVRDYGAIGDGSADNTAAFEAADAAAAGRDVLVPDGTYFLADNVTMQSFVRFDGTVTMPDEKILALTRNFDLPGYSEAFGNDELAFRKAFQALLNNAGHESLDLGGRLIAVTGPIDMAAAVANKTTYSQRRQIKNGQLSAVGNGDWQTEVMSSQATYSASDSLKLTNVTDVANVPVGAVVEGNGVGREVYVSAKNVAAQEVTLSQQLFDAEGTQVFTFRRFKYLLDFSGFEKLSKFAIDSVEFQCSGDCSGILLAQTGSSFQLRDSFITRPKDRGISSHAKGDQGMIIDRCQFLSDESADTSTERVSIGLNANANDVKLRDNRVVRFRHFAVLAGSSSIISGNHVFQGDSTNDAGRTAGLVMTRTNSRGTITGNYIDNCFIEWGNEHDSAPGFSSEFSFSGMNITDNVFLAGNVARWFTFLVVKPHGTGHFLNGMNVTGNSFRIIGVADRVETVDTSFSDLDYNRFSNVNFADNMFSNVVEPVSSPLVLEHEEASEAETWLVEPAPMLPFRAWAQTVSAVVPAGPLTDAAGQVRYLAPYYQAKQGPDSNQIKLQWAEPVKGTVTVTVRIDDAF